MAGVPLDGKRPLGDWQMARALSTRHHVLYVEPPAFPRSALRSRDARRLRPQRGQVTDTLARLRPAATPGGNRRWGARIADRYIAAQIADALTGSPRARVVLTFDPKRGTLPGLRRDMLVYWRRDRLSEARSSRLARHIARRDRTLITRADLVTGVSQTLVDEARALGATAHLVPNACDFEHFARPAPPPHGLPKTRPIIGFAGGVSWRLDKTLLAEVVRARPNWTFVLVGEIATPLPTLPNLWLAGPQPYDELPSWVQRFDVGIVPYQMGEFNIAAAPLKIYEYLAAGVPTVSTPLPALSGLGDSVRTAADPRAFVAAIETSLSAGPDGATCQRLARANDWAARVADLERHVDAFLATP